MHIQNLVLDIRYEISDVLNEIPDVREELLHIQNVDLDVRDEIQDVPSVFPDIRNVIRDVQNETLNIPEQLPDMRNRSGGKNKPFFSGGNPMAYKRRASQVIVDAQQRATNLKAIDPNLDLGNGLTVAAFDNEIAEVQSTLEQYNTLLAQADALLNELNDREKKLGTKSGRMLAGVGVKYGKDSSEYEMAGGTRTSEIKRGKKKEEPEESRSDQG
ncbi:hypothetical protein [Candidatus Electrothrix sp.]|uniref:hypothetical protein n=1 Tax=Candidatus Electrothrix sp. TaxID=2170559 RepID=UPI004057C4E0